MTVIIDGFNLTSDAVMRVARPAGHGRTEDVSLDLAARARIEATRRFIDDTWMHDEAPMMYSFNTGVGLLKDTRISVDHIALFQTQMIRAHAAGMGEPFSEEVSRATMLLRLWGLM